MEKQWSLYSASCLIVLILLRRAIAQGRIFLSGLLITVLAVQVAGGAMCFYQSRKKKTIKAVGSEK